MHSQSFPVFRELSVQSFTQHSLGFDCLRNLSHGVRLLQYFTFPLLLLFRECRMDCCKLLLLLVEQRRKLLMPRIHLGRQFIYGATELAEDFGHTIYIVGQFLCLNKGIALKASSFTNRHRKTQHSYQYLKEITENGNPADQADGRRKS